MMLFLSCSKDVEFEALKQKVEKKADSEVKYGKEAIPEIIKLRNNTKDEKFRQILDSIIDSAKGINKEQAKISTKSSIASSYLDYDNFESWLEKERYSFNAPNYVFKIIDVDINTNIAYFDWVVAENIFGFWVVEANSRVTVSRTGDRYKPIMINTLSDPTSDIYGITALFPVISLQYKHNSGSTYFGKSDEGQLDVLGTLTRAIGGVESGLNTSTRISSRCSILVRFKN